MPNDHQNENGTATAPKKINKKALTYVGALKEVEGALQTYGVQHLSRVKQQMIIFDDHSMLDN